MERAHDGDEKGKGENKTKPMPGPGVRGAVEGTGSIASSIRKPTNPASFRSMLAGLWLASGC